VRFEDLKLGELRDLSEAMATVAAASASGIFSALLEGPTSSEELAERQDLSPRATAILLPFLAELGLLEINGQAFQLTPRARRELADPSSPEYSAGGLPLWLHNLEAWTRLPEVLEAGGPVEAREPDSDSGSDSRREEIARFMAGMAAAPEERVQRLVEGILARKPDAETVLDLGGGPGHISRAFLERGLRATLMDKPEVVEFVDEEYGLAEEAGISTMGGDFLVDPVPGGPFDVVLLSNVIHMLSEDQAESLIQKVGEVTEKGSVIAVADFIRGRSPRAARFALVMLLRTPNGNTYTEEAHERWFRKAGFGDLEVLDLDPDRQLLTAVRGHG